jgi:hypothetical protein
VKALNDRARRGLKCAKTSAFYAEVRNSEWVNGIVNGKIQETGHSDIVPTMRYAALELAQLLPEAPMEKTETEKEREKYREAVERAERVARRARQSDKTYEPEEFLDPLDDDLTDAV